MRSNRAARVLLALGVVAAYLGYDAWIVSRVALDPAATRAAAGAVLRTEPVRRDLAATLTDELTQRVPAAAKDPNVRPAVAQALRDPRVTAAFADTLEQIHEQLLGANDASVAIDGRAVSAALRAALAKRDPALAQEIARTPPISVPIHSHARAFATDPRPFVTDVAVLGILGAALLFIAAALYRPERRAVSRTGRRLALLAVLPLVVFLLLPALLEHLSADGPRIAAVLLRSYAGRVTPSALVLATAGLSVMCCALVWPRRSATADAAPRGPRYTGPTPTPAPAAPAARPQGEGITDKLYL